MLLAWAAGLRELQSFRDHLVLFGSPALGRSYFDPVLPVVIFGVGGALATASGVFLGRRGRFRIAGWLLLAVTVYVLMVLSNRASISGGCDILGSFGVGDMICVREGLPSASSRLLALAVALACPAAGYLAQARTARAHRVPGTSRGSSV